MTLSTAILVAFGAVVGAPLRYAVERGLAAAWPWGTGLVNVGGSAVLGAVAGWATTGSTSDAATAVALLGVGFCGALTTFGGYAAQVLDLMRLPAGSALGARSLRASGYALVSIVACVAVSAAAYVTARSFFGG